MNYSKLKKVKTLILQVFRIIIILIAIISSHRTCGVMSTYDALFIIIRNYTKEDTDVWKNTKRIDGDIVEKVKVLKNEDGPDLHVHGRDQLIQNLLKNDLVDELWLKIYPITLGTGQRLFAAGTIPTAFKVKECKLTSSGVIIASYEKSGDVKLGSF